MKKAECTNCGVVDEFDLDGYNFGEDVLECIMFTINKDGKARIHEEEEDEDLKGLDIENWCRLAEKYVVEEGVDSGVCRECGNEVWVEATEE